MAEIVGVTKRNAVVGNVVGVVVEAAQRHLLGFAQARAGRADIGHARRDGRDGGVVRGGRHMVADPVQPDHRLWLGDVEVGLRRCLGDGRIGSRSLHFDFFQFLWRLQCTRTRLGRRSVRWRAGRRRIGIGGLRRQGQRQTDQQGQRNRTGNRTQDKLRRVVAPTEGGRHGGPSSGWIQGTSVGSPFDSSVSRG